MSALFHNAAVQAKHETIGSQLAEKFGDALEEQVDFRGERTFFIKQEDFTAVAQFLRDELQFDLLEDIVADDFLPDYPRFAVSYHLYSIANNHRIRLRLWVEDPEVGPPTAASIWPIAGWLETEVYDLMGIQFQGNDGLRRLFLPEDWQGHPLRKDYPLGYEEVQFSFNWEQIDARKPYAKD
jgi:NADH-quinone oxidoreductase subunit C